MAKRGADRERAKAERNARDREMLRQLGGRVRRLRETRGLSQERLAERAGLTSKYLGEVERVETNPSVTTLARLAEALSVRVGDLFEPADDLRPVPATQMDYLQETYQLMGQAIQGLVAVMDGTAAAVGTSAAPARLPRAPRGRRAPGGQRRSSGG